MTAPVIVRRDTSVSIVNVRSAQRLRVGTQGDAGRDGANVGISFNFSSATAAADPGSGNLRFNNATLSSVTAAYIDDVAANGANVSAWLDTFDDFGTTANRGKLIVIDPSNAANFRIYDVTGTVTNSGGYRTLVLAHVTGNGSFTNGGAVSLFFAPRGDSGSATVSADFALPSDISPAALGGNVDDYNPGSLSTAARIRHAANLEVELRGHAGGADGRVIVDENISSYALKFPAERASSAAANRIAAPYELDPGAAGLRVYDVTAQRWRPVAPRIKPLHIDVSDPWPGIPYKPNFYANFGAFPWLDPGLSFSRSTEATIQNGRFQVALVGIGAPCFSDSYRWGKLGYVAQVGRTNLFLLSQEFDLGTWHKLQCTGVANVVAAPDGTVTADKIVEDSTASASHNIQQNYAATSGTTYTASIYAKAAERSTLAIRFAANGHSGIPTAWFDLAAGVVSQTTGSATNFTYDIEPLPGGWYRCVITAQADITATATVQFFMATSPTGLLLYNGDGASGLYLWGAQLEAVPWATSYIPTTIATVTRTADNLSRSLADILNPLEGTLLVECLAGPVKTTSCTALQLDDGTVSNRLLIRLWPSPTFIVVTGGVSQANLFSAVVTPGQRYRFAATWKENDVRLSLNGATPQTDNSAAIPPGLTTMRLGSENGAVQLNDGLLRVAHFPRFFSDTAMLQALSA